jgi:hypothetical protein
MKIKSTLKFQEGGMAPEPGAAPMEAPAGAGMPVGGEAPAQGGEDPLMQIAQVAAQALQSQDCQAAMAVCEAFLMLIEQAGGGGGMAPEQPQEPTFQRKGGKVVRKG